MDTVVKVLKPVFYTLSLASFVLSFVFNNIYFALGGSFFFILLNFFLHESMHAFGCLLRKCEIKEFKVLCFVFGRDRKLDIIVKPSFTSYVIFEKKKGNWFIYLLGILTSVLFMGVFLTFFLLFKEQIIYHWYLTLSILLMFVPLIPLKGSDIINMFR